MQVYGTQLKDYYQRELAGLRNDAAAFAQAYPTEAQALKLDRTGSHDPHVEMLLQSFAFLTGRVQYESEVSKALIPNVLLGYLYPHLAAPVPSMLIAQVRVKPDDAAGAVLERGRQASVTAEDGRGRKSVCRFTTTCDLPLVPLGIVEIDMLQAGDFPVGLSDERCLSVLRVRVRSLGIDPVKALKKTRLRFYIDTSQKDAWYLQEMLGLHLHAVDIAQIGGEPLPGENQSAVHWLGFGDEEAALPVRSNMHPGHRLLQEYFSFPEKFMFFETGEFDLAPFENGFDLLFQFDVASHKDRQLSSRSLKLNCVPMVNLYRQRMEPLALDHTQYEYQLTADVQNRQNCEIYSIEELVSISADGSQRKLAPYFELGNAQTRGTDDYFYVMRREENQLGGIAGTEVYVSFLDVRQQMALPPAEVVGGRALCTNRKLAEQLLIKQSLQLEGAGPITVLEVISRPSRHITPALIGRRPWSLVSQLGMSHLSMAEGPQALAAFKSMLRDHIDPLQTQAFRSIEGIQALQCRPGMRYTIRDGVRGYVQCLYITLTLNRKQFESTSMLLFASVLRYFLALYSTVNNMVCVSLETTDEKGVLKRWPPMVGAQIVL
ncbi:type VI secretion system baseplate subunit TssF [Polaromonas sp. P5_D5]